MTKPMLSIVIPAYNSEGAISETLRSIRNPNGFPCEVIVVDDGSTDSTASVVTNCVMDNCDLRLICRSNGGVSAARNDGLTAARGEYIMFVDADDVLLKDAINSVYAEINRFPEEDILAFGMRFSRLDGQRVIESRDRVIYRSHFVSFDALNLEIPELLRENYLQSACSKVFKTNFLRINDLRFNERLNSFEDFEFVLACLENRGRVSVISEVLYEYRLRKGESGSRRTKEDMDLQMLAVQARIGGFCSTVKVERRLFSSLSAHLFINAVNSLAVTCDTRKAFSEHIIALRDSNEFASLFQDRIDFPNLYSRLVLFAVKHSLWGPARFLPSGRNAIRSRTAQPL